MLFRRFYRALTVFAYVLEKDIFFVLLNVYFSGVNISFFQGGKSDSANVNRIEEIDGKVTTTLLVGQCSVGMNKSNFY